MGKRDRKSGDSVERPLGQGAAGKGVVKLHMGVEAPVHVCAACSEQVCPGHMNILKPVFGMGGHRKSVSLEVVFCSGRFLPPHSLELLGLGATMLLIS